MTKSQLLKQVQWQDLRHLSAWQVAYNVMLPYPFLVMSWYAVSQSWYVLALIGSVFFVITAYRQGHDLFHQALGVSRHVSTALLFVISVLSFSSLHSMTYSHLHHHRRPLADDDIEGYLAKGHWYEALFGGLLFRYRLYTHGYRLAHKHHRRKIILETGAILLFSLITLYTQSNILIYQFVVMFGMNTLAGLIAVWGLHHDCDDKDPLLLARTERNPFVNALSFNLFYHAEHHLFPAVSTHNLPKLAKRLDKVVPSIRQNKVVGIWQHKNETCPIRRRFA